MAKQVRHALCVIIYSAAILNPISINDSLAAEESHPGIAVESAYSEAVLAFNKKQADQAIKILKELLAANPNHIEGLELMALSLKEKGDETKAIEMYQRLLKAKPDAERGPYYFELGMIFHKKRQFPEARKHFEEALKRNFNRTTSQLFLGMITFTAGDLNAAESSFNEVKGDSNPELQMMGHYFLGLIHFKNGYGAGGTHEMTLARNLAREMPHNKAAQDIIKTANQVLAPFNNSQWFGNVTALGQYDSNISSLPTSLASANASNKSTPNLLLNGGAGYMSSPTSAIQWVGNYRFNFNKTLNSQTKDFEYFGHTPALFFNYMPLARTTGGLKFEGNLTFQNQPKTAGLTDGTYIFRKYSTAVDGGPYFRTELAKNFQSEIEATYKNTTIDTSPDQSGPSILGRLSVRSTSASSSWNPGGALSFEKFDAKGTDYKTTSLGLSFFNTMKFNTSNLLNFSLDYIMTRYPDTLTSRADNMLTGRASFIHSLGAKWTLLTDFTYLNNSSNLADAYSYSRFMVGAGVGLTL